MVRIGGNVRTWDPTAKRLFWIAMGGIFLELALVFGVDDPHPKWLKVFGLVLGLTNLALVLAAVARQTRVERAAAQGAISA